MKLTAIERFEIRAEAFRMMTGHMAPGKDIAMSAGGDDDAREAAWHKWWSSYALPVDAMLWAFDRVMGGSDD